MRLTRLTWIAAILACYLHASEAAQTDLRVKQSSAHRPWPCAAEDRVAESVRDAPPDNSIEVRLCVEAGFADNQFDLPMYLHGLAVSNPRLAEIPGATRGAWVDGHPRWLVAFRCKSMPASSTFISFELAGRTWTTTMHGITWSGDGEHRIGSGLLEISLPPPTWPVLRSARFLKTYESNTSILELVVENRRRVPVAVSAIEVSASTDGGFRCAGPAPLPDIQTVHVSWPRAISHIRNAAWTRIAAVNVLGDVSFRRASCSDYYHRFVLRYSVNDTLPPDTITRLVYRISESHVDGDSLIHLPGSLAGWDTVEVTVASDLPLSPSSIAVLR